MTSIRQLAVEKAATTPRSLERRAVLEVLRADEEVEEFLRLTYADR